MCISRTYLVLWLLVWLLTSCGSSKKVVYLQDADVNRRVKTEIEYKTVIHPDDLLSIVVSCDDLESALPFNTPMIGLGNQVTTSSQQIPRGYLVDKAGEIDFPVLGKLKVEDWELLCVPSFPFLISENPSSWKAMASLAISSKRIPPMGEPSPPK